MKDLGVSGLAVLGGLGGFRGAFRGGFGMFTAWCARLAR